MQAERFGPRLRRLRLATAVTTPPRPPLAGREHRPADDVLVGTRWTTDGHLSCTGLARLARVDPAYVQHLEAGRKCPSRAVVERLTTALACSALERATLLVAAGHWPWPDADDDTTELLIALGLAVLDGDYRPLADTVRAPELMVRE